MQNECLIDHSNAFGPSHLAEKVQKYKARTKDVGHFEKRRVTRQFGVALFPARLHNQCTYVVTDGSSSGATSGVITRGKTLAAGS